MSYLNGQSLLQIGVGKFQLSFHFSGQLVISVESTVTVKTPIDEQQRTSGSKVSCNEIFGLLHENILDYEFLHDRELTHLGWRC